VIKTNEEILARWLLSRRTLPIKTHPLSTHVKTIE